MSTRLKPAPAPIAASLGSRVAASPLARRLAADNGLDLALLTGSGPNGRIVKTDVKRANPATAPISNVGMFGIRQFEAVINPPQGMILAIGAGEKRPYIVDDQLSVATVMSATGSFDHRAIDGADGAALMKVLKELFENPLGMLA